MEELKSYIDSIRETPEFELSIRAITTLLNGELFERERENAIKHKKSLLLALPEYADLINTIYRIKYEVNLCNVYAKYNRHKIILLDTIQKKLTSMIQALMLMSMVTNT